MLKRAASDRILEILKVRDDFCVVEITNPVVERPLVQLGRIFSKEKLKPETIILGITYKVCNYSSLLTIEQLAELET